MAVVTIIGGGLAGSEAAWQAASAGVRVVLHEMRPVRPTSVHKTDKLAELVCSNSFRGDKLDNAVGVLKEEMRRLGSLVMAVTVPSRRIASSPFLSPQTRSRKKHSVGPPSSARIARLRRGRTVARRVATVEVDFASGMANSGKSGRDPGSQDCN